MPSASAFCNAEMVTALPAAFMAAKSAYLLLPRDQQRDTLAVVRNRELDLLGALGVDRHELEDDIDLVRQQVRNPHVGSLLDVVDGLSVAEQGVRDHVTHLDIESGELPRVVGEVPWRVARPGPDRQLLSVDDLLELAARGAGCGARGAGPQPASSRPAPPTAAALATRNPRRPVLACTAISSLAS